MMAVLSWCIAALTLDQVVAAQRDSNTLSCSFTSEKKAKMFRQPIRGAGRLTVARGGKLRLETRAPEVSLLLVDGESLKQVRGQQVSVQPLSGLGQAKAFFSAFGDGLLGDTVALRRSWSLESKPDGQGLVVSLLALAQGAALRRVELRFAPDGLVTRVVAVESSGDEMTYELSSCERGVSVADDLFSKP